MNKQLIEKVIRLDDCNTCLELTYKNPLVDRNVAGALAKSFVNMLVAYKDSNINKCLRHTVLTNIRKICRTSPENHVTLDEADTDFLIELYMKKITSQDQIDSTQATERSLDEFLMRHVKDIEINSNCKETNPEILQALVNLSKSNSRLSSLIKDVLYWDTSDKRSQTLINDLWTNSCDNSLDDISIKNKVVIESFLLNICFNLLTDINLKIEELFTQEKVTDFMNKCSNSSECFQITIAILNSLFIQTNYNIDLECFITRFIMNIKEKNKISLLYPVHLRHIVVLLNFDLEVLPITMRNQYTKEILLHLKKLHDRSEADLILLFSHYPYWFDVYFSSET